MHISISIAMLLFALSAFSAQAAEVAVIVNKENRITVDKALISRIYLGYVARWPGNGSVAAVDLPEGDTTAAVFVTKVLGKSVQNVKEIWAQNVFTGKALPPKVAASDADVINFVSRNKNAIGYVNARNVDKSVRVVLTAQ